MEIKFSCKCREMLTANEEKQIKFCPYCGIEFFSNGINIPQFFADERRRQAEKRERELRKIDLQDKADKYFWRRLVFPELISGSLLIMIPNILAILYVEKIHVPSYLLPIAIWAQGHELVNTYIVMAWAMLFMCWMLYAVRIRDKRFPDTCSS